MKTLGQRFPVGREVRVRIGREWIPGVVREVAHATVTVTMSRGRISEVYVHESVIRRDLRVGARKAATA